MPDAIRVLIAEDTPSDAELVVRELRRAGFEPEWRRVDTEADYLRALAPELDVILSDYSMPQFDAPRALQLLQERGFDIPFIIVSGTVGEDAAVAAMKDGASDYLLKDRLARLGAAVRHAIAQRREREQRRRVETQLRRFVASSPAVIYALAVKDGNLVHSWVSENITRATGHDEAEASVQEWWRQNIHPQDAERVLAAHAPPYATDLQVLEYRFRRKDGSWLWVRDEKRLLRDAAGEPVEVVGSWADITERKQAEAQRDVLAQQRQLALSAAHLGWWHYDPATRLSSWDERYQEIFGVSESARPNEEILARLHPDDLPHVLAAVEAALDPADSRPYSTEYRLNHPDGQVRWVEAHGIASFEGDGEKRRATSLVGTVQDITERKQMSASLASAYARYRSIFENAVNGIFQTTPDGRFLVANPAMAEICGYDSPDELIASVTNIEDQLYVDPARRRELDKLAEEADVISGFEAEIRRKDGSRTWISSNARVMRDEQGARYYEGSVVDIDARKRAEEALQESDARLRVALEAAGMSSWEVDLATGTATWSANHFPLFGLDPERVQPSFELWCSLVHPEDLQPALQAIRTGRQQHSVVAMEYRIRRADDRRIVWLSTAGRFVYDARGEAVRAVGVVVDITERKHAEAAVREGEARLSGVVNSAMDAIITVDAEQRVVLWNAAAERMFRCTRDEALGRAIDTFVPARFRASHERHVAQFGTAGVTSRSMGALGAISGLRTDGEEFPIEASISQTDVAGKKLYTVILRDITDRKRAERWLAMQHAVTRVLADSNSLAAAAPGIIQAVCESLGGKFGAIWEIDRQRNVLRCADVWHVPDLSADALEAETRQLTFAPRFGLPGRVWATGKPMVVPDVTQDANFARAVLATQAGLPAAFGFPILLQGEVAGVVDFLGPQIHGPDQSLLDLLSAIGTQIGQFIEHRRADQQLLQAQKMEAIGQLAGGIAHDFNNLLGVILGYSDLASRELGAQHKTNRRIQAIGKAAERAAALTRQILTFSRKQAVELRVCDLNHIVEEMEKMLRRLIGEDVRLAVVLGERLGSVRADAGQLEQVIMNLAVNARDAMPSGGRLVIETSNVNLDVAYAESHPEVSPGPHVLLSVSDTGMGMEPGIVARIFEPFFTTKDVGKGTGLGLAVVYGIIKQSGGSLSVDSAPRQGSTFKVFLPRVETEGPTETVIARGAAAGGSEVVLLVEDEAALRGMVAETLRMEGYTVLEASDPQDALVVAAQNHGKIQLLITDVVLPGQSGPEMARQMRNAQPGLRVLLMSGYPDRLADVNAFIEPGTPFLGKPFTLGALLLKVREVLDSGEVGT